MSAKARVEGSVDEHIRSLRADTEAKRRTIVAIGEGVLLSVVPHEQRNFNI